MRVGEFCNRNVVTATPDLGIEAAARLMRERHVGALVVLGPGASTPHPIGIVTDRDLVVEVLAQGPVPAELRLADVMSTDLMTADFSDGLWETLERMSAHGVRRVPVVNRDNVLEGVLSVDDVVQVLAEAQGRLVRLLRVEQDLERSRRPARQHADRTR